MSVLEELVTALLTNLPMKALRLRFGLNWVLENGSTSLRGKL